MTSRAMSNEAEKAAQAWYESLGYTTDRARPQAQTIADGRTIFLAYDFLKAFDIIGIGPEGALYSQVTMAESNLSKKRRTLEEFNWPIVPAALGLIRADVLYAERVPHPSAGGNRKAWKFTVQTYNFVEKTWTRRGTDKDAYVFWDGERVIPQVVL